MRMPEHRQADRLTLSDPAVVGHCCTRRTQNRSTSAFEQLQQPGCVGEVVQQELGLLRGQFGP